MYKFGGDFLYNSNDIANRIKLVAKQKGFAIGTMFEQIGINKNSIANFKTSMPRSDSLAKIADYLDCSVDYLLGRCTQTKVTAEPEDTKAQQLLKIYYNLSNDGQSRLLEYAIVMDTSGLYSPKNSDVSAG